MAFEKNNTKVPSGVTMLFTSGKWSIAALSNVIHHSEHIGNRASGSHPDSYWSFQNLIDKEP